MEKVLVNLGYFLMLLALIVRDILWLRSILMSGQLALAIYGFLANNIAVTFWNSLFFIINFIQVVHLIKERRPIELPLDLADLHESVFSSMTRREFLFFWHLGAINEISDNYIVREGKHINQLYFILIGSVNVVKDGINIARLSKGSFIAEMSFLTGEKATADIFAHGTVKYISWNQDKLKSLELLNPELLIKIQNILGRDLVTKVKEASINNK